MNCGQLRVPKFSDTRRNPQSKDVLGGISGLTRQDEGEEEAEGGG